MHRSCQHIRCLALAVAGLALLGAAFASAQLFITHAQERQLVRGSDGRQEKIGRASEAPPVTIAPTTQTAAPAPLEADCTIRRERRIYCAQLVIADSSRPVERNVTSTIIEVRNISNDVTITGSNNYVVTKDVGGFTSQNNNNSIQKAFGSADVYQQGSNTFSLASGNFGVTQVASASYLTADDNVFVIQDGSRSYQFASGETQIVTQRGYYSANIANGGNVIQSGHNTSNYFTGTENGDVLAMQSDPISSSYTGNRFFARMGGGDDYVKVVGTRLTADIDGGDGNDAVQLEGLEQDYIVTTNADGSKAYTNERQGNIITVRNVEYVIIGDNFPGDSIKVPPAEATSSPIEAAQRVAERLGMSLNLPWRVVQADRLMRQRLAQIEPELKERLRQTEAAEKSASGER